MVIHTCIKGENPLLLPYGGIRAGGGYVANTEYEIGLQRVAEATHCILGSLYKIHKFHGIADAYVEYAHIDEELSIVMESATEYGKPMYTSPRLFSGGDAEDSKDSILYHSLQLNEQADCYFDGLKKHKKDIHPRIYPVALTCYELLSTLGRIAALCIVEPVANALASSDVKIAINRLKIACERFLDDA